MDLQTLLTIALNGGVTWGVVRTTLWYMRRDIDRAHKRLDRLDSVIFRPAFAAR